MTYHALLEYIREAKLAGASDQDIRAQLTGVGWYTVDVQDALRLYATLSMTEQRGMTSAPPGGTPNVQRYDPRLIAIVSVSFAVGFIGYLLIASL